MSNNNNSKIVGVNGRRLVPIRRGLPPPSQRSKYNTSRPFNNPILLPTTTSPRPCVVCKLPSIQICQGTVCTECAGGGSIYQPNPLCTSCTSAHRECPRCVIYDFYRPDKTQEYLNSDGDEQSFSDWSLTPSDLEDCDSQDSYLEHIQVKIEEKKEIAAKEAHALWSAMGGEEYYDTDK